MTRPGLIVGAAIVVAAAVSTAAWLMLPPGSVPPPPLPELARTEAPGTPIVVPEATSPPEVTGAEFGQPKAPSTPPDTPTTKDKEAASVDWPALPIDEGRKRANADDVTAMEEIARRLVQGSGGATGQ